MFKKQWYLQFKDNNFSQLVLQVRAKNFLVGRKSPWHKKLPNWKKKPSMLEQCKTFQIKKKSQLKPRGLGASANHVDGKSGFFDPSLPHCRQTCFLVNPPPSKTAVSSQIHQIGQVFGLTPLPLCVFSWFFDQPPSPCLSMWFVEAPCSLFPSPNFSNSFSDIFWPLLHVVWAQFTQLKNNTIAFYPVDLFADSISGPHVRDEMFAVAI